jgi:hypothetical protein
MNKTGLWILLLLSMVLVLYPSVTALMDAENALREYDGLTVYQISFSDVYPQLVALRNNLIMQNLGFVFLFLIIGTLIYSRGKETNQQNISAVSQENKPTMQAQQPPASNEKRSNRLFILSGLIFIIVFFWQFARAMMNYGSMPTEVFVYPIIYALIASSAVGIALHLILKNRINEIER